VLRADVRGIQSQKIAASVKHFACNNRESNRFECDSRVSERALREIYLRGFEICVKEADPWTIMSSYNLINGCHTSVSYELLTEMLRNEWGFKGMVTTDWGVHSNHSDEVLAGNDVKMGDGEPEELKAAFGNGKITRADLETSVKRILELTMKSRNKSDIKQSSRPRGCFCMFGLYYARFVCGFLAKIDIEKYIFNDIL